MLIKGADRCKSILTAALCLLEHDHIDQAFAGRKEPQNCNYGKQIFAVMCGQVPGSKNCKGKGEIKDRA